jgi:hypothetical protein
MASAWCVPDSDDEASAMVLGASSSSASNSSAIVLAAVPPEPEPFAKWLLPPKRGRPKKWTVDAVLSLAAADQRLGNDGQDLEGDTGAIVPFEFESSGSRVQQRLASLLEVVGPTAPSSLLSVASLSRALEVVPRTIARDLMTLAALVDKGQDDAMSALMHHISSLAAQGRIVPVVLQLWRKYDETPFKLRVRWQSGEQTDTEVRAKLVAIERAVGMVLALPQPQLGEDEGEDERRADDWMQLNGVLHIRCSMTTRLRVLSSMTAAALCELIRDSFALPSRFKPVFEQVDNIVVTDEHASNMQALAALNLSLSAAKHPIG